MKAYQRERILTQDNGQHPRDIQNQYLKRKNAKLQRQVQDLLAVISGLQSRIKQLILQSSNKQNIKAVKKHVQPQTPLFDNFLCITGNLSKKLTSPRLNPLVTFAFKNQCAYIKRIRQFAFPDDVRFILRSEQYVKDQLANIDSKVTRFGFLINSQNHLQQVQPQLNSINPEMRYFCFCLGFLDIIKIQSQFIQIQKVFCIVSLWNFPQRFFQMLMGILRQYKKDKASSLFSGLQYSQSAQMKTVALSLRDSTKKININQIISMGLKAQLLNVQPLLEINQLAASVLLEHSLFIKEVGDPQKILSTILMILAGIRPLKYIHPVVLRTPKSLMYIKDIPTPVIAVVKGQVRLQRSQFGTYLQKRLQKQRGAEWVQHLREVVRELLSERGTVPQQFRSQFKETQLFLYYSQ